MLVKVGLPHNPFQITSLKFIDRVPNFSFVLLNEVHIHHYYKYAIFAHSFLNSWYKWLMIVLFSNPLTISKSLAYTDDAIRQEILCLVSSLQWVEFMLFVSILLQWSIFRLYLLILPTSLFSLGKIIRIRMLWHNLYF